MSTETCIICNANTTKLITEAINGENPTVTIIVKLQSIAPEVDWCEEYCICEHCLDELLIACRFKERCLKVKDFLLKKETSNEDYAAPDIKDDLDSAEDEADSAKFENPARPESTDSIHECSDKLGDPKGEYKRKHKCHKCGRRYVSESSLRSHEPVCDGIVRHGRSKAEFQCKKCKKYYMTNKILRAHTQKCEVKVTNFQCVKCYRYYTSSKVLRKHLSTGCKQDVNCKQDETSQDELKSEEKSLRQLYSNTQSNKKPNQFRTFICERCGEKFTILRKIIEHCLQAHSMDMKSIKPYLCETCNARFRTSTNLANHQVYHKANRTHTCSYCGKSFITKRDLTTHEPIHFDVRSFKCPLCDKSFKTSKNLYTHKVNVHTDPSKWKYMCTVCGKRFAGKSNHDQHMRRHLGEKSFVCHICSKAFTSKKEMKEHEEHHSNIRPHKCEQCGKEYRNRYSYKIHLTKVHGIGNAKIRVVEKKFACHICPAKFGEKGKLSRHLCVHTGLKPYSCTSCDKKFTDKSYLKHHLKVKHNMGEEDCL